MKRASTDYTIHGGQPKVCKIWKNDFVPSPRLERLALLNTCRAFYRQTDIQNKIQQIFFAHPSERERNHRLSEFNQIVMRVNQNIENVLLPRILKDALLETSQSVGHNVLLSLEFQVFNLGWTFQNDEKHIRYTSYETIDYEAMVKISIQDSSTGLDTKYILACDYCLEDEVISIWQCLPLDLKILFVYQIEEWSSESCMLIYWTGRMTENNTVLEEKVRSRNESRNLDDSCNEYMAGLAMQMNESAFKYFWGLLTLAEKKRKILKFASYETDTLHEANNLVFLMAQMDETAQEEFFRREPFYALYPFVYYSQCHHLLPMVTECILRHVEPQQFPNFVDEVTFLFREFINNSKHILYLLKILLLNSSIQQIQSVFEDEDLVWIVCRRLFELHSNETIFAFLNRVSIDVKKQVLSSDDGIQRCATEIVSGQYEFLDTILSIVFPVSEEEATFKRKLMSCVNVRLCLLGNAERADRILHWCCLTESEITAYKELIVQCNENGNVDVLLQFDRI